MKKLAFSYLMALAVSCGAADDTSTDVVLTESALYPACTIQPSFHATRCPGNIAKSLCWYNIGYNVPVVGCSYSYTNPPATWKLWSDCVASCP